MHNCLLNHLQNIVIYVVHAIMLLLGHKQNHAVSFNNTFNNMKAITWMGDEIISCSGRLLSISSLQTISHCS